MGECKPLRAGTTMTSTTTTTITAPAAGTHTRCLFQLMFSRLGPGPTYEYYSTDRRRCSSKLESER